MTWTSNQISKSKRNAVLIFLAKKEKQFEGSARQIFRPFETLTDQNQVEHLDLLKTLLNTVSEEYKRRGGNNLNNPEYDFWDSKYSKAFFIVKIFLNC